MTLTVTDSSNLISDDTISIHVNTPPNVDDIQFSPATVYSADSLSVSSTISDAEGHTTTAYFQWYENGQLTSNTTSSVPSSDLDVGDLWTVRVTPDDGFHAGAYSEASITVSNTIPIIQTIAISPSIAYNDTTLTCSAMGFDPDQTLMPTYEWSINNTLYSGSTLDLSTTSGSFGDVISCTASVVDAFGEMASDTVSISIDNRTPTIASITITPNTTVEANALLNCAGVAQDLDNDPLTWDYEWFQNGQSIGFGDNIQLDASLIVPGDSIECLGVVSDSYGNSSQSTNSISIVNSAPSIDSLLITPSDPTLTDVVTCTATTSDTNGDTPVLTFTMVNQTSGVTYTPTSGTNTDSTLDLSTVVVTTNDILECSVMATDNQGAYTTDTTTIMVVNPAPTFSQPAIITPAINVTTDTALTCSATAIDPDGGVINYTYNWFLGGQTIASGTTFTADAATTDVGDSIECIVIAFDSDGDVATSTSNSVVIENTDPSIQSVVVSPSTVYTNDTVSASVTAIDLDDDPITYTYEWHRIDASLSGADILITSGSGSAFASITGVDFDRDDDVYVLVTPDDGRGGILLSPTQSNAVTVSNSTPVAAIPVISGASTPPFDGIDDLTCSLSTLGSDVDADSLTYTYEWIDANGTIQQTYSNTTATTDVFLGSGTTAGTWICQVTTSDGSLSSASSGSILVEASWDGTREFNNCGQTGQSGPSQSQCDSSYSGSTLDGEVILSGGYQTWTVPATGTYLIEIAGAAGGGDPNYAPGYGAYMSGEFTLTAGDELTIVVGQVGDVGGQGGGGGGGTFVVLNQSTPIIIAGGGGGSHYNQGSDTAYGGQISTTGAATSSTGSGYRSGSGGGWFNDGTNGDYSAEGGKGWNNGLTGGVFANVNGHWSRGNGGFGGGGGGCWPAGSGGGYYGGESPNSGGNTTPGGAGGGSYNIGINQSNIADTNNDHGYAWIERL